MLIKRYSIERGSGEEREGERELGAMEFERKKRTEKGVKENLTKYGIQDGQHTFTKTSTHSYKYNGGY